MKALMLLFFLLVLGCYSFSQTSLPGHIKTITIYPAENKTYQALLGDQLTQGLQSLFRSQAPNLRQINSGAHAEFITTLVNYANKPASYDSDGQVSQYKVSVMVDIEFTDKVNKEPIYKKQGLIGSGIYDIDEGETEESHGQKRALEDIQELIISNALSAW